MQPEKKRAKRRVIKLFEPSPRAAPPKAWPPGNPPGGKLPPGWIPPLDDAGSPPGDATCQTHQPVQSPKFPNPQNPDFD